jgi:hypothetical protein
MCMMASNYTKSMLDAEAGKTSIAVYCICTPACHIIKGELCMISICTCSVCMPIVARRGLIKY